MLTARPTRGSPSFRCARARRSSTKRSRWRSPQASGQPTQRYAYTTYSVNGSATQTRLLVENPDEAYADSLFDTAGVL